MKKISALIITSFLLFGCSDPKKQEKDLLAEVIKVHDHVMGKEELLMANKLQLDTIMIKSTAAVKKSADSLKTNLDSADARMENWMHEFDAENKGKSHDEIIKYLNGQKKEIAGIDSQMSKAISTSHQFIIKNKVK